MNNDTQITSQLTLTWRRLSRNKMALIGLIIIAFIILVAVLAPYVAPYDPLKQDFRAMRKSISAAHWFGTDQLGRDIFSRIIVGAGITLRISFSAVFLGLIVGVCIGMLGGYYGNKIDLVVSYITDILLAFPGLLLAMAIVSITGPSVTGVVLAVGLSSIPQFVRMTRGVVLSEKEKDYVMAARAIGENSLNIMLRYILPNCLAPLTVLTTLRMAVVVLIASGLSFLGLGVQPPTPEWGAMLNEGRSYLQTAPLLSLFPGLTIMFLVLAFNLLGDGLRDALDPRMKL
ncbi:MAG: ABC transporter permease [Deltaproteobacteria bacterium]|jgi:peptide/nickel transport system permease protein|nr:ABC transporter permease [Deltaproteobacteria bacterium]MBT4638851.1 ABC transporter permease [Deltaproteobacteria bacterium]MBT6502746.1 ABC transporter permease [Deltaproteobacteria bacterium]MBT7152859.1 ABC transporter permease [Deltaproteobacteria bacterium]MBT7711000.1 ABC transporter permease [Deltaproteobacteria bacterium]